MGMSEERTVEVQPGEAINLTPDEAIASIVSWREKVPKKHWWSRQQYTQSHISVTIKKAGA